MRKCMNRIGAIPDVSDAISPIEPWLLDEAI
jgi:hypothetical protein